jgi:hypothetical protein
MSREVGIRPKMMSALTVYKATKRLNLGSGACVSAALVTRAMTTKQDPMTVKCGAVAKLECIGRQLHPGQRRVASQARKR